MRSSNSKDGGEETTGQTIFQITLPEQPNTGTTTTENTSSDSNNNKRMDIKVNLIEEDPEEVIVEIKLHIPRPTMDYMMMTKTSPAPEDPSQEGKGSTNALRDKSLAVIRKKIQDIVTSKIFEAETMMLITLWIDLLGLISQIDDRDPIRRKILIERGTETLKVIEMFLHARSLPSLRYSLGEEEIRLSE